MESVLHFGNPGSIQCLIKKKYLSMELIFYEDGHWGTTNIRWLRCQQDPFLPEIYGTSGDFSMGDIFEKKILALGRKYAEPCHTFCIRDWLSWGSCKMFARRNEEIKFSARKNGFTIFSSMFNHLRWTINHKYFSSRTSAKRDLKYLLQLENKDVFHTKK